MGPLSIDLISDDDLILASCNFTILPNSVGSAAPLDNTEIVGLQDLSRTVDETF
jgi:hypothetical protein